MHTGDSNLVCSDRSGVLVARTGVPLADVYLEFLGGRCRPNTVRAARRLPRILAPAEVDALMAALFTHRDRAMVAAMVLGGLRRCEVLGLRLEDLHAAERQVFIAEGKGGRQRLIPVSGRSSPRWLPTWTPSGRPAPPPTGSSWS